MIAFIIDPKILRWMTEYLENVRWYLKERFDLESDVIHPNQANLITDAHDIIIFIQKIAPNILFNKTAQPPDKPKTKRLFLLNTEQATLTKTMQSIIQSIRQYKVHVIDYSPVNIELMRPQLPGVKFIHFPFPFRPKPLIPKTIPVISLVTPGSKHRRSVIATLQQPVRNFYNLWSKARDTEIQKSKILVNVHYNPDNYRVFESIRCYNALEYRTLVVSEPGIFDDKILLHDYIIFAPAEKLPEKVTEVLENYDYYYEKMFSPQRLAIIEERFATAYRRAIDEIYGLD